MEILIALIALSFVGLFFFAPIIALVRAGRAARGLKQSESRTEELTGRVYALEQQVIKLTKLVPLVEDLRQEIEWLKGSPRTAATVPTETAVQPSPAPFKPSASLPVPAETSAPPAFTPTPIHQAPAAIPGSSDSSAQLEKQLRGEIPPPRLEVPARVEVPPPSIPPPPPVEIPPQRLSPPAPPKPAEVKIPSAAAQPLSAPRLDIYGRVMPSRPPSVARPVPPPPVFVPRPPSPSLGDRMRRLLNIEEVLGANYLGKLGVIILVIGVAGLVGYKFSSFPVWLQFLSAYLVGLAMLASGVRFEAGRYRLLARAGIGGGWASIFVTTWALHHAGKTPVVASETLDLILMLLVAVGMVAHTLKYNSQVVTGLAFLLPTLTITVTLYFATDVADATRIPSLVASAILAAGLVVIVVRRHWFELEVFGIASTFVNHFLWIRPIVERHQGFPEYYASAALLISYWAVFRASYIVRKVSDSGEEAVSTVAALLNTILLLAVLKYQALHPEMAFYFLLALGAVELILGQLPATRKRRTAFVILTTLGAIFLVAALPYKLSGATLPVVWLAEAEAFFLAGVFTREIVFRRLGMIAGLIVAAKMNWMALAQVTDPKFTGLEGADILKAAVVFGTAASVFYANSHVVQRRWPDLVKTSLEDWSFRGFSYIAGSVAFLGLWLVSPEVWTAVTWSGFALLLAIAGARLKIKQLSTQVPFFAAAAILRVFTVNYYAVGSFQHVTLRLITVSLVAGLLYAASRWMRKSGMPGAQIIAEGHTWAATALVAVLIWHESPELWRAVAWATMALALALIGRHFTLREFSRQAHFLAAAAFAGCFVFDLVITVPHHHDGSRLIAVLLTAGFIYMSSRQLRLTRISSDELLVAAHTWSASALLALLAWYELRIEYAAPAWIMLGFALALVGRALKLKRFSFQAYVLSLVAFLGALSNNLIGTNPHTHITLRFATVSFVAGMLYVCSRWGGLVEVDEANYLAAGQTWEGTILLALLAWYELPGEYVAPVWCGMALALVVIGSQLKRRGISIQGHLLALAGLSFAIGVNLPAATLGQFDARLLITVGLCAALLYLCSPWSASIEAAKKIGVPEAYAWAGSLLVSLLIWYELQPVGVAVGWALFGIVLFELGFGRRSASLRLQAYIAFTASFLRSLYVNFNTAGNSGEISLRVWTTVFLAGVFFYAFGRLVGQKDEFLARDRSLKATQLFGYLGAITVAALVRSELEPNWVVAGWALMILVLLGVAWKMDLRIFLHQGLLLSFAVLYRTVLFNFYQSQHIPMPSEHSRLFYVSAAAGLLFLSVPLALKLRAPAALDPQKTKHGLAKLIGGIGNRPEQALFFIPYLLLTMVLWLELPNAATLSWGLEAVIIFLFALWAGQRSFRLAAVALLLACVVRIALVDFWKFNGSYRWLTAMGLGIALIAVSFLYTRYHEAIRRYL